MEKRKYLGQINNNIIKSMTSQIVRTDNIGIPGFAALENIHEVNRPLFVGEKGNEYCIIDAGYTGLIFQPDNEKWSVVTIYNDYGDIIEWYFDINKINTVDEEGKPYRIDLYLDVALMPNGNITILDEDELQDALNAGLVTKQEFDMAYEILKQLLDNGTVDVSYMTELSEKLQALF